MARSVEEVGSELDGLRATAGTSLDYGANPFGWVKYLMAVQEIPGVTEGAKFDPFAESTFGSLDSTGAPPGAWHWWANSRGARSQFLVGLDLTGGGYYVALPIKHLPYMYTANIGRIKAQTFTERDESGYYMGWTYDFMSVEAGMEDMTESVEFVVQGAIELPDWL